MDKITFAQDLVSWYEKHQRQLPWRQTTEPYCIWISEIMLQQTQVQTVIPYYNNFINHFPNVLTLAHANLEEVYKCWEGLGYYSRARNLQYAALQIVEQYQGIFPCKYETILTLKGIGPYTAAAISSIAFGEAKGVVDGNVLRIISRLFNDERNIALASTRQAYQVICDELIAHVNPSSFNQGLMDLGATICKPRHPLCSSCPVRRHCQAYAAHRQNVLPVNLKKIKHQEINYLTCLIHYQDKWYLFKNDQGILGGLYGLPQLEVESPLSFEEAFKERYQEEIEIYDYLKDIKHVFTHRTWIMRVYVARFLKQPALPCYSLSQIEQLPLSTAHKKVIQLIKEKQLP